MRPLQCYFDTNCLQAALLYFVYHSRPEFVDLAVILMRFEKVNRKLVL